MHLRRDPEQSAHWAFIPSQPRKAQILLFPPIPQLLLCPWVSLTWLGHRCSFVGHRVRGSQPLASGSDIELDLQFSAAAPQAPPVLPNNIQSFSSYTSFCCCCQAFHSYLSLAKAFTSDFSQQHFFVNRRSASFC